MEKPFVIAIRKGREPTDIERRLEDWGCRVQVCERRESLEEILIRKAPDLFILDRELLADGIIKGLSSRARKAIPEHGRFIVLEGRDGGERENNGRPSAGLDLLDIDRLLHSNRTDSGRRHLRLAVRLPGIYLTGGASHIADVMTLGTGGAFLKTPQNGLKVGQKIDVVIPLLGMKKEIEVTGRIVHQEEPTPENNYSRGVGLQFLDLEPASLNALLEFLLKSLLEEPFPSITVEGLDSVPSSALRKPSVPADRGYRVSFK